MIRYIDNGDVAVFDNLNFRKDKKTGYYLNAKTHKRLHVYVWEHYNGKVPKGCDIHHKDFNKDNNSIDNLALMDRGKHHSLHGKSWTEERYKRQIENLNVNARPRASEWHGSEIGKEWHKEHYGKMKDAFYQKKIFKCDNCGKEFEAIDKGRNRFCSGSCRSAYRRKTGTDDETRICEWCGNEFTTNRYSKARTCSRSCRNFLRWNKGNQTGRESSSV